MSDRKTEKKREDLSDLPVGFTMALSQNGPAMMAFAGLDEVARESVIARARAAKSKEDMRELVSGIGGNPPLL